MPDISILVKIDSKTAEASIKRLDRGLDDLSGTSGRAESKLSGLWKQFAIGDLAAEALRKTLAGAKGLAGSFLNVATETENYEVRLKALLGSQEAASEAMEFFEKVASKVPFTLEDIIEAGTTVTAFGADLKKWTPILADLAAVMGMDVTEAANALGRAYAGGAGAADIFRERGILQIIKDSAKLKSGINDITKLSLPQFRDAMYEAFTDPEGKIAGAADDLSLTWDGMISMMEDHWFQFRDGVMEAGVFDFMEEGLRDILDEVNRLKEEGKLDEWAADVARSVLTVTEIGAKGIEGLIAGFHFLKGVVYSVLQIITDKIITFQANLIQAQMILAKYFPPASAGIKDMVENLMNLMEQSEEYRKEADKEYETSADIVEIFDKLRERLDAAIEKTKTMKGETEGATGALDGMGKSGENLANTLTRISRIQLPKWFKDLQTKLKALEPPTSEFVNEVEDAIIHFELLKMEGEETGGVLEDVMRRLGLVTNEVLEESESSWMEYFNRITGVFSEAIGMMSGITGQWYQNQMIQISNLEQRQIDNLDLWYQKQKDRIEQTITDEEEKKEALEALEEEYNARMDELHGQADEKARAAKRQAAEHDKAVALMAAIVNVAQAITRAYAAAPPPFNLPLAALMAALGAIQIAAIKAQPIPLAKGAIFERPTYLVGEAGPEALIGVTPLVTEIRRTIHEEVHRSYRSPSRSPVVHVYIGNERFKNFTVKTIEREADLGNLHLPQKVIRKT